MSEPLNPRDKVLLTPAEVGQLIGVSARTARRIIEREQIPTVQVGISQGLRVPRVALDAWVARRQADFDAKMRQIETEARVLAKIRPVRRNG